MNLEEFKNLKVVVADAECLRDVVKPYSFDKSEYLGNAVTCTYAPHLDETKDWIGDGSIISMWEYMLQFDAVITYNGMNFDYPLWGGSVYGPEHVKAKKFFEKSFKGKTIDLARDFQDYFKKRIRLIDVSVPTLGDAKEMDGGFAPQHWRAGRCLEVIEYCRGDNRRTNDIYQKVIRGESLIYKDLRKDLAAIEFQPTIKLR